MIWLKAFFTEVRSKSSFIILGYLEESSALNELSLLNFYTETIMSKSEIYRTSGSFSMSGSGRASQPEVIIDLDLLILQQSLLLTGYVLHIKKKVYLKNTIENYTNDWQYFDFGSNFLQKITKYEESSNSLVVSLNSTRTDVVAFVIDPFAGGKQCL